jgi:hypothetical protein
MAVRQKSNSSRPSTKWALIENNWKKHRSLPLYSFNEKRIEPIGSISLPVSFGILCNSRTEHITFDVVDTHYHYNTIFGTGLLNTFEVAPHSVYLCLKVPAALGVISIHGNQKDTRNIEQGFATGHRNVNCLQHGKTESCNDTSATKSWEAFINNLAIEPEWETKRVPQGPRVPDRIVMIS